jgi:hypothetical protein
MSPSIQCLGYNCGWGDKWVTLFNSGEITTSGYLQLDNDTLLHNGDFETNTTDGWSSLGSIVTGGYSGNYTSQSVNSTTAFSDDYIPVNPVTDVIELEGWFKETVTGSTPGVLYFGYDAYDSSKAHIGTAPCGTYCYQAASGANIPNDSAWHKYTATMTGEGTSYPNFPVGTKFIRVLILLNYGSAEAKLH